MPETVIVTGASSGIGAATARHLAAEGWQVIAAARRAERLSELVEDIRSRGGSATAAAVDVTAHHEVTELVEATVAEHGRIDAFVANAGVMPLSRLDAGLVAEWDRMIDVNIRGLLHGIDAVLPHFHRQGRGHLVTVASVGAYQVTPTAAVYCGTKFAERAITEGLRLESDPGIRVSTISPGVVTSELADSITDPEAAEFMRAYREHAIAPESVATAIGYALTQPAEVDVNEIVIRPAQGR
ncbi:SDR family oxidoreductase [Sciscionella sediminilitoris]|uniref:SDR family oxidoreductase n=1 Tax=Sciscionella sediminilitoris TaxID=1445613 RepID=UPI0004DF0151|nr:SDR family oxidoreductase [Sciscionella sp. SE31]